MHYDESNGPGVPTPHPDDAYKPTAADAARWKGVWDRMAHDRQKERESDRRG